jgi:polysaccharide pyruvyl transferase WcaK-like protein
VIVVLHAFSRRNAGDGLLVDLTLDRLERAGAVREQCHVVALDPESFADLPHVHRAPGEPWHTVSPRLVGAAGNLLASSLVLGSGGRLRPGALADLVADARFVVGVGGGYLRSADLRSGGGVLLNHVGQLQLAAAAPCPTVYLPQSIGPLRGLAGRLVARLLRRIDAVHVRDDRSAAELGIMPGARRTPDLAVLHLAEQLDRRGEPGRRWDGVVIVPRGLGHAAGYPQRLLELADRLGSARWAVQADVVGPKSDRAFVESLGLAPAGTLSAVLPDDGGVVVAVRLHGALQALLAGRPAVHLAYDRKGWGAYGDLGLTAWVHDARTFDPATVADQVRALQADPAPFWDAVADRREGLLAAGEALTEDLRRRIA